MEAAVIRRHPKELGEKCSMATFVNGKAEAQRITVAIANILTFDLAFIVITLFIYRTFSN